MPELNRSGTAIKFNKYYCHNRYMESCCNKYSNCWNNDLYLYSCCRSVCFYYNNEYCSNYFYYPDIYTDRTTMSE